MASIGLLYLRFLWHQPRRTALLLMLSGAFYVGGALGVEFMIRNHARLGKTVHGVPDVIDREVARLKLRSLNVGSDRLTSEQRHYLSSWSEGT